MTSLPDGEMMIIAFLVHYEQKIWVTISHNEIGWGKYLKIMVDTYQLKSKYEVPMALIEPENGRRAKH